ncbi:MAG: ATP-binding protein [Rhodothermales bacterium]|nr:ATP-binding protein [Rhodothermales bacterium]
MSESSELALTLPSTFAVMDDVTAEIQHFLDEHVPDEDVSFRTALVASEAITNALEHGNGLDASKTVTVRIAPNLPAVRVEVTDEGPGFDPASAPRSELGDFTSEGGRGLTLMYELADEVLFEDDGRMCILLVRPR